MLADYFNSIGGTSTGAIIAALLAWGKSIEEIKTLYENLGDWLSNRLRSGKACARNIWCVGFGEKLRDLFLEDGGQPAVLGTERLRSFLLLVLRKRLYRLDLADHQQSRCAF